MLITLSGLDGAGKSTVAEALKCCLEKDGTSAVVFHMNKDVGLYAYVRNLRDALTGGPRPGEQGPASETSPIKRPGRAKLAWLELRRRIIWNKPLRRWVDLGDLGLFYLYRLFVEKFRGRVLIMDRYFYDRVADQANGERWKYLRWFSSLAPRPDVAVLVEVSPEEAFERKGEYSIESMTARRIYYREIFGWIPGSVILPNDDLEVAVETLAQIVRGRLSQPGQARAAAGS